MSSRTRPQRRVRSLRLNLGRPKPLSPLFIIGLWLLSIAFSLAYMSFIGPFKNRAGIAKFQVLDSARVNRRSNFTLDLRPAPATISLSKGKPYAVSSDLRRRFAISPDAQRCI